MRRGIVIGGMVLGLLMGCNNGGEDPQKVFLKSVVSLGNEFLDVFTSFGDMIGGETLGFKADSSKKEDVGKYFKNIEDSLTKTKTTLNNIVDKMQAENNPNAAAVKTKVDDLIKNKLDNIIDGAKTASGAIGEAKDPISNVASPGSAQNNGGVVAGDVDSLVRGIKGIVDVVLKEKGNPEAGDDNKATDLAKRNNDSATKLFASDNSGSTENNIKKLAADASKAVGAVTGADILKAIIKDNGAAAKLAKNVAANASNVAGVPAPKDAEVAGGIALRAMAKGGKFANASDSDTGEVITKAVKGAAVSAVTKALDTLTIAIRKTIDEGLKEATLLNQDK